MIFDHGEVSGPIVPAGQGRYGGNGVGETQVNARYGSLNATKEVVVVPAAYSLLENWREQRHAMRPGGAAAVHSPQSPRKES